MAGTISLGILFVLAFTLARASITDLQTGRIPNRLLLWAFALVMPSLILMHSADGVPSTLVANLTESTVGGIALFFVTFLIWLLGGFGGGDVKLLTFIGMVVGAERGLAVLLLAQILAAAFIVARRVFVSLCKSDVVGQPDQPVPMAGFFSIAVVAVLVGGTI
ncbi:prepilin peptidase [Novipirellula sp. SH528]|uniref:prepilin peptidase n=1 Tax=Novipirellula sp. SH528 TaxID=3454466 RepID=UPI003FA08A96